MADGRVHPYLCGSIVAVCLLGGCHSNLELMDSFGPREIIPYTPRANSQNAFDAYALAALDAEKLAGPYVSRVSFFPDQKTEIIKALRPCVRQVSEATRLDCEFRFVPHRPFTQIPYQNGWRFIGRVYEWNADRACTTGDYDTAIANVTVGTKFGFDLTAGGATDASLGLSIVDELRRSIAPYLAKMSPSQLDRLARGIKDDVQREPSIATAIKNEHENILQSLRFVEECMTKNNYDALLDNMGPDVNEAIRFLSEIGGNERKQQTFLTELTQACESEYATVQQDANVPTIKRPQTKIEFKKQWRKLPKYLLGSLRPLLSMSDATCARTRLLLLYAEILKFGKEQKPFPSGLSVFSNDLTIDPFTGKPFLYHADQAEFTLYSVGANCRDDGGDTDETYSTPDLKLECPGP
ncbi:MAG: hypothetical protein P4L46_10565 [Fimbriimonas sp.]|nr:hypothetical protein [Fimbriimonas sp.]